MVVWRVWEISVKGSESFTINNAALLFLFRLIMKLPPSRATLTITIVCFILIERLNCIWKMLTAVPARKMKIKFYSTQFASRKLRSWSNRILFFLVLIFWACSFISLISFSSFLTKLFQYCYLIVSIDFYCWLNFPLFIKVTYSRHFILNNSNRVTHLFCLFVQKKGRARVKLWCPYSTIAKLEVHCSAFSC